jgi:hypothetical protein
VAEVEPPELARLVDVAERPRVDDWSLRAALVRYAQPQPARVSAVLECVRRLDFALKPHTTRMEKQGPDVWAALQSGDTDDPAVGLLQVATALDALGDVVAAWAADRSRPRPDDEVDAAVAEVAGRLDELGVAREEGPPGPRGRRGV